MAAWVAGSLHPVARADIATWRPHGAAFLAPTSSRVFTCRRSARSSLAAAMPASRSTSSVSCSSARWRCRVSTASTRRASALTRLPPPLARRSRSRGAAPRTQQGPEMATVAEEVRPAEGLAIGARLLWQFTRGYQLKALNGS